MALIEECLEATDMIFVDEMGINLDMSRAYGRAPKGERVVEEKPANTPSNTTVIGALGAKGLIASLSVEGSADGECFSRFVEQMLAPALEPGQVVLMDNVKTHKSPRVLQAIEAAGAGLVYLPAYSPDLNPIEECWSKMKGILRTKAARAKGKLMAALKEAIEAVTPENIRGWYEHSGYYFSSG